MKSRFFAASLLAVLVLTSPALMAQKRRNIPSEKPQLIIGIVVESMRYDYIHRYWDNFGEGGFRRLIGEGALCRNANYNYMLTQTSPGDATIATGCEPIVHGIVSDAWYVQLQEKNIGAAFDEKVKPVGVEIEKGTYSPRNIHRRNETLQQQPLEGVCGIAEPNNGRSACRPHCRRRLLVRRRVGALGDKQLLCRLAACVG